MKLLVCAVLVGLALTSAVSGRAASVQQRDEGTAGQPEGTPGQPEGTGGQPRPKTHSEILSFLRARGPKSGRDGRGPMQLIQDLILSHPDAWAASLYDLLITLGNDRSVAMDTVRLTLVEASNTRTIPCTLCQVLFSRLKGLTNLGWPLWKTGLNVACNRLMLVAGDFRTQEMCPGVVDLQMYYIYTLLSRDDVTALGMCEVLNVCYPPDTRKFSSPEVRPAPTRDQVTAAHAQAAARRRKLNRASTVKVLHMTDIHVEPEYKKGALADCGLYVCCKETNTCGPDDVIAEEYGDYNCNTPLGTLDLLLQHVATDIQPDVILYSGDSPPHTFWDETSEKQASCSAITAAAIATALPGYRVHPAVGNHDNFPTNIFTKVDNGDGAMQNSQVMMWNFTDTWAPLAGWGTDESATVREGGYYSQDTNVPGLRVLCLNSNTEMYSYNWFGVVNSGHPSTAAMRQHAADMLAAARRDGDKVLVMFHHPAGNMDAIVAATRWWAGLVSEYRDVIVLQVAGHTHDNEFHLFREGEAAVGMQYVAPSLTPSGHINPSLRVYHLDINDLTHVDYDQFILDIDEGGLLPSVNQPAIPTLPPRPPEVTLLYSALSEYGLTDMTPESWLDFTNRCETNETLFETFYSHRYSDSYNSNPCDSICRDELLCSVRHANFDEVYYCRQAL